MSAAAGGGIGIGCTAGCCSRDCCFGCRGIVVAAAAVDGSCAGGGLHSLPPERFERGSVLVYNRPNSEEYW